MCGIFGAVGSRVDRVSIQGEQNALAALAHRGPDARGIWRSENVMLGHRRLSILDLDHRADQPMRKGPLVIVFNGEVYNFKDLRKHFEHDGEIFETTCDTEVLLVGLLRHGIHFLDRVEGMFAFAAWDDRSRSLTVARDRFGEKPLFLSDLPGLTLFASEIAGLEALSPQTLEEDLQAIGLYMRLSYVPAPYAPFKGTSQLEPGTWRRFDAAGIREEGRYYRIPRRPTVSMAYEDAVGEVREKITRSVDLRLKTADVPVATLLSGGLDSSIVTTIASNVSEQRVAAYSLSFPADSDFDEGIYAAAVARRLPKIEHRVVTATVHDLLQFTDRLFERLSEPLADASLVPTAFLMSHIEEKVVLSGDGADEAFGGYGTYSSMCLSAALPKALKGLLLQIPAHKNPTRIRQPILRAAALFHANLAQDPLTEYLRWRSYATPADLVDLGVNIDLEKAITNIVEEVGSGRLRDIQEVDIAFNLPNDMLRKVDIASMMFSIEARLPYLDSELVAFALSLPDEFRIKGRVRKRILRDAFLDDLPAEILQRRKMGFLMPIRQWFRAGPLRDCLVDLTRTQNCFDCGVVDRLVEEHRIGRADHSVLLWALLVYLRWRKARTTRLAEAA